MAAGFKTVEPLEYYRRFLKENCRPDGRELGEFRTTTVNIGSITTADGSALVKLGNTTVICGIKAEFAQPPAESTNKGYIVPNVDLPPLCSSRFRPGPPGEEAQAASQFIADVIENSEIIMKEDLCIAHGKLAWVLYCDFICLDYDGNILDACTFALLAALKNVQLPKVTINEETGLAEVDLKQTNPLNIRKHPVATSFAVFDDTILIVDPTAEEEDLATGTVTIVMDEEGRLCSVHKPAIRSSISRTVHAGALFGFGTALPPVLIRAPCWANRKCNSKVHRAFPVYLASASEFRLLSRVVTMVHCGIPPGGQYRRFVATLTLIRHGNTDFSTTPLVGEEYRNWFKEPFISIQRA
ncbi:exosome complex component RRP43 isoform X1 [Gopherus flavomarginatus]|uniref:exosome complex component RRP43 isoform X1 n=1 Tax=Gopherus flavomarginatus TaxID=286002 RepID=UPI0021CBB5BA|nr:exosome complex component RRP43 isoform X1 [Gopherus flavomarginatus]